MMKLVMLVVAVWALVGCSQPVVFTVNVRDEDGGPVKNATVTVKALKNIFAGIDANPDDYRRVTATTDTNGVAVVKFDAVTDCFRYWLAADGYYSPPFHKMSYRLKRDHLFWVELAEHEKEETVVLRRIKNPIPMFACGVCTTVKLPAANGDYGFDMMAGELVAPFGKGRVADFHIRKDYDEKTRSTKSALFFSGRGNGAYRIKAFTDSEFRSSYEADTNAVFLTQFRYEASSNAERTRYSEVCDVNADDCLVLRTRCRFDEKGNLVSCHYSKLYGRVEIRDRFVFRAYAFNPTPNDPNLEFDVTRDLLKKDTSPYLP
ncbi:MAG: hypothetical protein ACI4RA_06530 [Kiritimatiellia bacterium]